MTAVKTSVVALVALLISSTADETGFARSTSDAVVFMDHGQAVESGPAEQIFEAAETHRLRRFCPKFCGVN